MLLDKEKERNSYWERNEIIIRIGSSYYERSEIVKLGNEVIVFKMIVFLDSCKDDLMKDYAKSIV
jgi:hypothetical protein